MRWFLPIHRRSRMWLLVSLCQVIVATALMATMLISQRMQDGFTLKAAEFIAADVRIRHADLDVESLRGLAGQNQLQFSYARTMLTSVLTEDEDLHLVHLKAVDGLYPLRGALALEGHNGEEVARPPQPGYVWVDTTLRNKGLRLGQSLRVGDLWLQIGAFVVREPDRALVGPAMSARVMISHQDLDASGLIRPNSRADKQVLLAGARERLDDYVKRAELPENARATYARDGRRDIREIIRNLSLFVNLAGFVAMLFAAVILYLALQLLETEERRMQRLLWQWGYGFGRRSVWFWARIAVITVVANVLGAALALLLQDLFATHYLSQFFAEMPPLFDRGVWPATQLSLMVLPVAALSLWQCVSRPWLNATERGYTAHALSWLLLAVLVGVFFASRIDNLYLLSGLVSGVFLSALMYLFFVRFCLMRVPFQGGFWSLLRNNLSTRPRLSLLYVCSLSLVVMIAMTVFLLREGMLVNIEENLSADSPNHYLLSIQPDELDSLSQNLSSALSLAQAPNFYPIVRARVIRMNGENIDVDLSRPGSQRRLLREWGLSHLREPSGQVTEGRWFRPLQSETQAGKASAMNYAPEWSVSTEIIDSLGADVGDELTFRVAGSGEYSGRISSIRKVNWSTIKPNFFVLASPGLLDEAPTTYITALRLNQRQTLALNPVLARFPGITHLDLNMLIERFQELLSVFVDLMWIILIYSCVLVLTAVACILQFGIETTRRETALLTSFGVSAALLGRVRLAENLILAVLAVLPAALIAGVASHHFYTDWPGVPLLQTLIENLWALAAVAVVIIALLTILLERFLGGRAVMATLRGAADYHS